MFEPLFYIIICVVAVFFVPTLMFFSMKSRHQLDWASARREVRQTQDVGEGPFRKTETIVTRYEPVTSPWYYDFAAFSSFCMGQMVLPSIPAVLLGLLYAADDHCGWPVLLLLASSLPGMILGVNVWRSGAAMMSGRWAASANLVNRTWLGTMIHNSVLLIAAVVAIQTQAKDVEFMYITLCYAPVSMIHMSALRYLFRVLSLDNTVVGPVVPHVQLAPITA